MFKTQSILLLTFLFLKPTYCQTGIPPSQNQAPLDIEKVYVQTDREYYFLSDTIWFKAYLLNSKSLIPVSDIQTLHVELIDTSGSIVLHQKLLCENGLACGRMSIPDTIIPGPFLLRSYTNYQRNFGEDLFFSKALRISRVKSSLEIEAERSSLIKQEPKIDVTFFPEGGFLLSGNENLVAFKAIDQSGAGIDIEGVVVNDRGEAVVAFKSNYKGMGRLSFTPEEMETYRAIVNGFPDFEYEFKDIRTEAKKLVLMDIAREDLTFQIQSNQTNRSREMSHIVCFARDSVLFQREVSHRGSMKLKVETDILMPGVNRIVLLDENFNPLSERLVFRNKQAFHILEIGTNRNDYSTRSQVELTLTDTLQKNSNSFASLSVSVVNRNALVGSACQQHMASYLLLDSELHGYIEAPAEFFHDDQYISSNEKLDLLMLTHGWSNYQAQAVDSTHCPKSAGISIAGHAEQLVGTKPLEGGSVTLGLFTQNDRYFLEEVTDEYGHFLFDSLVFYDSASIFLQVLNNNGKKRSVIFLDNTEASKPKVTETSLKTINQVAELSPDQYRQKFMSEQAYRDFTTEEWTIHLEEVEVVKRKAEKPVDDGHFRIYSHADQVLEVKPYDYQIEIVPYLLKTVPGLRVVGGQLWMRGTRSMTYPPPPPLFVVNGIPISDNPLDVVAQIPMSSVDKIEIIKGVAAIYGSQGANGVIAIYTKNGEVPEKLEPEIFGVFTADVMGYQNHREFYSPKYTSVNRENPKPDHRTTLYWNPEVTIAADHPGEMTFFTSDDLGYYRIIVEGITDQGEICFGTSDFMVDSHSSEN